MEKTDSTCLNLAEVRARGQNSSVYRWKSGVGKINAITNRLHNSFKIKDDSLTGRNYERNKKYGYWIIKELLNYYNIKIESLICDISACL